MAFSVADLEEFIALLRNHPEWRQRVREEILSDDIARIDARFERMEKLLEATVTTVVELRTSGARIEASLVRHEDRFDQVDARFDTLEGRFDLVEGRLGNLEGSDFERKFNAPSRLGGPFRRPRRIELGDVEKLMEARDDGVLNADEMDQLASLDFLIRARRGTGEDAPEVLVAFEVSMTVDGGDVRRAANRAALIRKAGLEAEAYAGGRHVTASATALARELGVHLVISRDRPEPS